MVDYAKVKQGLYTPGMHFLIYPVDEIDKRNPDYLLVLCWNLIDEVVNMRELQAFKKRGGKFIVSIPEMKII